MALVTMGSNSLLTEGEASELLGLQKQSLRRLEKKGVLTPCTSAPRRYYASDVSALKEVRGRRVTPEHARMMAAQAYATARSFDQRLQDLEYILGGRSRYLPMDQENVIRVYLRAVDALEDLPREEEEILEWANTFVGIHGGWLDMLEAYTDDTEAWSVLHKLCLRIAYGAPAHEFTHNKRLEAAYGFFRFAATSFKSVVHEHVSVRYGHMRAHELFIEKPESVDEQLVALILSYT